MKILITGAAGFIGFHLVNKLLDLGNSVIGVDNINDYYDTNLKYGRLNVAGITATDLTPNTLVQSSKFPAYKFVKADISDYEFLLALFETEKFDIVVNLAAQAGVRYSLINPHAYINANVAGFLNVLECCRKFPVKHLVYASSSSVYGLNETMPFSTSHNVDHPVSLYAASKKSNELMAHAYSHLYNIPTTGLRFFTVYGPWGRPDMAYFLFTDAIIKGKPISVFNNGNMSRDFTYIDDILDGMIKVINSPSKPYHDWSGKAPDPSSSKSPYRIYNIGNSKPVSLLAFIEAIEEELGKRAVKEFLTMQPGDVVSTWADTQDLQNELGYKPSTDIKAGVKHFVNWYKDFYL